MPRKANTEKENNVTKNVEDVKKTKSEKVNKEVDIEKSIEERAIAIAKEIVEKQMAELLKNQKMQLEQDTVVKNTKSNPPERRFSKKLGIHNDFIDTDSLDKTRRVPVINIMAGSVGYNCLRTSEYLKWEKYGDEHMLTIDELLCMSAKNRDHLYEPMLIVDDAEFADTLKLTELYDNILAIDDLEKFYNQPLITINKKIRELPTGARTELFNRTVIALQNGEITNMVVLKVLKEFNVEANM